MDKKAISKVISINLGIFIITMFGMLTFINEMKEVLWSLVRGGTLNSAQYSIIQFKFIITYSFGYKHTYYAVCYPLISILVGIIYNIGVRISNHRNEKL